MIKKLLVPFNTQLNFEPVAEIVQRFLLKLQDHLNAQHHFVLHPAFQPAKG